MASEGLLGFIAGVTGTLSEEYDRINDEKKDIRKEGRAEDAAIRAEARREMAEKRMADYRKQLDFDWSNKATDQERSLLESGKDVDILRTQKEREAEAELLRSGEHPDILKADALDLNKAARIRGGVDADTAAFNAEVERAPLKTELEAEAERAKTDARNQAEEESDRRRRAEGNFKVGTDSKSTVSFKASEADSLLKDALGQNAGASVSDIRKRVSSGESVLAEIKDGSSTIQELIAKDPANRDLIRQELIVQMYPSARASIMELAKRGQVESASTATEIADVVAQKADELIDIDTQNIQMLREGQAEISKGKKATRTPQETLKLLEDNLAASLGEDDEKRSASFKQIWSVFKHNYEKELGLKVK